MQITQCWMATSPQQSHQSKVLYHLLHLIKCAPQGDRCNRNWRNGSCNRFPFKMQYSKLISWDIKHWHFWQKASILKCVFIQRHSLRSTRKMFCQTFSPRWQCERTQKEKTSKNLRSCPNSRYLQVGQVGQVTLVWRLYVRILKVIMGKLGRSVDQVRRSGMVWSGKLWIHNSEWVIPVNKVGIELLGQLKISKPQN